MDVFYALAEPRRRRIIEILAINGKLTATEICKNFRITPQAISQHLKILLDANILYMERNAQQRIYQINPNSMREIERWTQNMETMLNKRFDRLDKVLKVEMKRNAKKR